MLACTGGPLILKYNVEYFDLLFFFHFGGQCRTQRENDHGNPHIPGPDFSATACTTGFGVGPTCASRCASLTSLSGMPSPREAAKPEDVS